MNYDDLQTISIDNQAGTKLNAWAIPYSEVYHVPTYQPGQLVILDPVIPKPYKIFRKIYATANTGKIDDNLIDGKVNAYESIYEFFFPKNDKMALGFMRMSSAKWIFILEEANNFYRIFGIQPGSPAVINQVNATTGTISSGDKGATFKVRSIQNGPAPVYLSTLNLSRLTDDLSLYPMIYDEMKVSSVNSVGFPLVIDYYTLGKKTFSWIQQWNSYNQLTRRQVVVYV